MRRVAVPAMRAEPRVRRRRAHLLRRTRWRSSIARAGRSCSGSCRRRSSCSRCSWTFRSGGCIHQPIGRDPADDAARGRRATWARAPRCMRDDEIGAVASGLNEMLAQMENFNVALQDRCARRRRSCAARTRSWRESYERVLDAARGAGARRADGGGRPDGGQRGAPDRHAAQPHLGLRADDPRGTGGRGSPGTRRLEIVAGADRQGHVHRADDARPRAAAVAEGADRHRGAGQRVCDVARPKLTAPACGSTSRSPTVSRRCWPTPCSSSWRC